MSEEEFALLEEFIDAKIAWEKPGWSEQAIDRLRAARNNFINVVCFGEKLEKGDE